MLNSICGVCEVISSSAFLTPGKALDLLCQREHLFHVLRSDRFVYLICPHPVPTSMVGRCFTTTTYFKHANSPRSGNRGLFNRQLSCPPEKLIDASQLFSVCGINRTHFTGSNCFKHAKAARIPDDDMVECKFHADLLRVTCRFALTGGD